ncbi:MAG: asparagine synthetase [Candidatus Thorarchaeota archaeon]|nr:asparagine synthetase [Candidatus Thorarchaeota archaeon]
MKNEKLVSALKVQSIALDAIRSTFRKRGLTEILPVILSTSTDPLGPDPRSNIIATSGIEYQGQKLVLTQSMILHKQIIVSSGLEKFFTVSPNIRLESPKNRDTGCHLFEFSQVDFELAWARMEDVFSLVEETITEIIKRVRRNCSEELALWGRELKVPQTYSIYTTTQLVEQYGSGWLGLASMKTVDPFWVIDHKREFYDAEDSERSGAYRNYDLVYPEGFGEALSGGEREWAYDRILMRMKRDGLRLEDFKPYLESAQKGFVPSAGAGLGVERLTRFLVGAPHIGDIQAFRRVPGERVII